MGKLFETYCKKHDDWDSSRRYDLEPDRDKDEIETAIKNYEAAKNNRSCKRHRCKLNGVRKLISNAKANKYDELLTSLDMISLEDGATLHVDEAERNSYCGDISHLYVTDKNGNVDFKYFKYLKIEDSCEGVWQLYMLVSIWHNLPFFWHGGYNDRIFLLSKWDLRHIRERKYMNSGDIIKLSNLDLTPIVVKNESNGKYYVSACYWSDWGGVMRELFEITLKGNSVTEVYYVTKKNLFEYDCGILY